MAEIVGAVRRRLDRRALLGALLWVGVTVAAVLLLAWLMAGGDGWDQGTRVPLLLDLLLVALVAGGAFLFRRARAGWLSEGPLSASMEEAAGLASGTVRGALELARSLPAGVSPSLAALADRGASERLRHAGGPLAGRTGGEVGRFDRPARLGLAALGPLVLAAAVLAPGRSAAAWLGLGSPFGLAAAPVLAPLDVMPGDVEILRGTDLTIEVRAQARDSVTLHWQAAGDVARTATADASRGTSSFTMRDVRAPVRYWASAPDGARTATFRITPVDPLFVHDVTLELTFPPHTARPPEEYRGDVPPLVVPAGTRMEIAGWASRELGEAALETGTGEGVALDVDGRAFSARWTPRRGGLYRWRFQDADGTPAELAPQPVELTIVSDSAPRVRFVLPGRDTVLPLDLRQPLVLQAADDYGLASLELVAYRVTALGERQEPVRRSLDLGGSRAAQARPLLDVSAWGLLPGDTVRYHARAVDNGPGGQEAVTREYVLRMPAASEMRRDAQERLEDVAERMQELAERAAEAARESREMERQAASDRERSGDREVFRPGTEEGRDPLDFQQREDMRRAMERQAELEGQVDSVAAELERLSEAMREAGMSDSGFREDMEELQELLEQLASSEMRRRLEEAAEGVESADARQAREALRQLTEDQEAFRERLEESLERFRRAAVEQDFRATTAEAEDLAREESALADALREDEDASRRASQQEALEQRAGEMESRMERLEERLQQLGEQPAAREVQQARQQASEARSAMQQARQQAMQQQGQQAGRQADQAAASMEQAGEQLQQAQQQMAQEQAEAMQRALQGAAEDALSLARRQGELRERMRGADAGDMEELRGDVAAVEQGVRNMAEEVARAAGTASPGQRALAARMGQAMDALERTVSAMEGRTGASPSPTHAADQSIDALNQVALMAMEGARQATQQGQQQGGAQQVQQQMESLAQQQGSLNNQASQMMPMQLGQQALQQQLRQMAQGQQSVAQGLGELSRQPGSEEQTLGDLQALAQEAEALARELDGGRLDPETRARQEQLFHRLLDAGRSLEKEEEESEQRESESPGVFERQPVLPLSAEALNALRYRLPAAAILQRLGPAERQLVIQYFERLNRGTDSGGGR